MSARSDRGVILERCACGRRPSLRTIWFNRIRVVKVECACGAHTVASDDREAITDDWNEALMKPVATASDQAEGTP